MGTVLSFDDCIYNVIAKYFICYLVLEVGQLRFLLTSIFNHQIYYIKLDILGEKIYNGINGVGLNPYLNFDIFYTYLIRIMKYHMVYITLRYYRSHCLPFLEYMSKECKDRNLIYIFCEGAALSW